MPSVGEDGETGTFLHCWWEYKMIQPPWKKSLEAASYQIKHMLTLIIWLISSFVLYSVDMGENTRQHKDLYMNVYSCFIHNIQKLGSTQMPINWWMDKKIVFYPYSEMPLPS